MKKIAVLSIFLIISVHAKDIYLVNVPVLNIYAQPANCGAYESQVLYGHNIEVIEMIDEQWCKVDTSYGVDGYARREELVPDKPLWRAHMRKERIKNLMGFVYATPTVINQPIIRLPYNAYVKVRRDPADEPERWVQVELVDGSLGWIVQGDLEPLEMISIKEMLKRTKKFLGLPYLWGGNSTQGYDCSAFLQTMAHQMGYPMLRFARQQAVDPGLVDVDFDDIQPGDFLYFGRDHITHTALYIEPGKIIHAAGIDQDSCLMITDENHQIFCKLKYVKRLPEIYYRATISEITDVIFEKMKRSWHDNNPVPLRDLRYLTVSYWGFDSCVHQGELIVHAEVAQEVVDIFEELFEHKYPIERMNLIDVYDACDSLACADNNSSAFCSRLVTGHSSKWSYHSYGLAIDLNTRINPYKKRNFIEPINGAPFLDRSAQIKGLIRKGDSCYQAFIKRGWKWGGDWTDLVDYQHFSKGEC